MKKQTVYAWACDFSSYRGEGILARKFAKDLSNIKKINLFVKSPESIYIVSNGKIIKKKNEKFKNINFSLLNNYIWPIYGIFYLWIQFFKNKKILYLNFMPLWNFLLFYFLPPKIIIGPITGFIPKNKIENISSLIRIILIPLFYKFSLFFIFTRFKSLIFSTDLLKNIFLRKDLSKLHFNYLIASSIKNIKRKKSKREIDFLVYNRNYSVKEHYKLKNLIRYLIQNQYNVKCIGDNLEIKRLTNYGIVSREKAKKLLKQTKLIISSPENPYSLFTIDALNMGTKVLFDKKYKKKLMYLKYDSKNFISLDNQNYKSIEHLIMNKKHYNQINYKYLNLVRKRILSHFENINF